MPKKKKKEKTGGAANGAGGDEPGSPEPGSPSSAAPADTARGGGGPAGGLDSSVNRRLDSLNKPPAGAGLLPPLKGSLKMMKEGDPNLTLLPNAEMAEMEQALEAHQKDEVPGGLGGGMNVFAINKDGISRAVVKFNAKPEPMPLTISFHFPGTFLTHRYVVAIIKGAIQNINGATVTHVQYIDRNVRLGTRGLENRWLVTVSDMAAKQQLIRQGIKVVNRTIYVKSYDDVIGDEYRDFQRWADLQNRLKMGFGAKNKKPLGSLTAGATDTSASPKPEDGEGGQGQSEEESEG